MDESQHSDFNDYYTVFGRSTHDMIVQWDGLIHKAAFECGSEEEDLSQLLIGRARQMIARYSPIVAHDNGVYGLYLPNFVSGTSRRAQLVEYCSDMLV